MQPGNRGVLRRLAMHRSPPDTMRANLPQRASELRSEGLEDVCCFVLLTRGWGRLEMRVMQDWISRRVVHGATEPIQQAQLPLLQSPTLQSLQQVRPRHDPGPQTLKQVMPQFHQMHPPPCQALALQTLHHRLSSRVDLAEATAAPSAICAWGPSTGTALALVDATALPLRVSAANLFHRHYLRLSRGSLLMDATLAPAGTSDAMMQNCVKWGFTGQRGTGLCCFVLLTPVCWNLETRASSCPGIRASCLLSRVIVLYRPNFQAQQRNSNGAGAVTKLKKTNT